MMSAKRARGLHNSSVGKRGCIFILSWFLSTLETLLAPWRDRVGQPSQTPTHYYCTQSNEGQGGEE